MFALRPNGAAGSRSPGARGQLAKIHLVSVLEPFPGPDLQNLLGRGLGRAIDHLDLHAKCLLDPILAPTSVEHASTHRYESRGRGERAGSSSRRMPSWSGTFALCTAGLRPPETLGVHQQMPLPAADILASVEAPLLAAYPGALGRLRIDYTGARLGISAEFLPQ